MTKNTNAISFYFCGDCRCFRTSDGDLVLGHPWNVQKPGVEIIEGVGEVVLHAGDSVVAHPGEFHAVGRGAILGQLSCLVTASRHGHARNFILF